MAIPIFPTTPMFAFPLQIDTVFNNAVSDYDQGDVQTNRLWRFPKHEISQSLIYTGISQANRDILYLFWRALFGNYKPFWLFDLIQRKWLDEFLGYGGPLPMDGAIADDGGVQTDETVTANAGTANGMTLLPAGPLQNDAYYFGAKSQFDKITINVGTAGVGKGGGTDWTVLWEYRKSDLSWASLAGFSISDGTNAFHISGSHDVTFTPPTDWISDTVKNLEFSWVRARVNNVPSLPITTQPKGTSATVSSKYFDLPSKSTTNDASLIVYQDGVATAKTFDGAHGGGGADRIYFGSYPALGALITADFQGYMRFRMLFGRSGGNRFPEKIATYSGSVPLYDIQLPVEQQRW